MKGKKCLTVLLALFLAVILIPVQAKAAQPVGGTCGDDLTWTFQNGTLTISGGHTTIVGPTQGDTATLDFDVSGVITGGTFIGTGARGMAQTFTASEQGVIALQTGNQAAGTKITLTDANGKIIIDHTPELGFAVVILSCPEMVSGQSYTVTIGAASGTFTAN